MPGDDAFILVKLGSQLFLGNARCPVDAEKLYALDTGDSVICHFLGPEIVGAPHDPHEISDMFFQNVDAPFLDSCNNNCCLCNYFKT